MFYAGYFFGVISSGSLLALGYWLCLWRYVPGERGPQAVPRATSFFPNKKGKKTPKFVSEEEQAKRESRVPISDVEKLRERHYSGD